MWGTEKTAFSLDAYKEHSAPLAAHLEAETWEHVLGAVMGIRHLNGLRESAESEGREFTKKDREDFERIGAHIDMTLLGLEESSEHDRSRAHSR